MADKTISLAITEDQFEKQVKHLASLFDWEYYHTWKSYHSPAGFPDCVLVNPELQRTIFAELKSETGQPSPDQYLWLVALTEAGNKEVYLWRPSDFDEVAKILRGDSI